jgi:hypothetical protein
MRLYLKGQATRLQNISPRVVPRSEQRRQMIRKIFRKRKRDNRENEETKEYLDTLRAEKLVDGKDILFGNVRLSRRIDVSYLCLRIGCQTNMQ